MILERENLILARLQAQITGIQIESFPEKAAEYNLKHPVGAILLHYSGAKFGKNEGVIHVVQETELKWGITLIVRNLRTQTGAYAYLDSIRAALTGYRPYDNYEVLYPLSEQFLSNDDNLWVFAVDFGHNMTMEQS